MTINHLKMPKLDTYLTFDGNCMEAFEFYQSIFGGEFSFVGHFGDMPPTAGYTPSEEEKKRIMHISLPMGDGSTLMGSDTSTAHGESLVVGTNMTLSYYTKEHTEADRIFAALSEGGKVGMPMADTFWQSYFGMVTDRFGIQWMLNADPKGE